MKVHKIKSVKGYKSFADFEWQKFCKNKEGKESIFDDFNIIFGENGSGKSSICDVLKSVSQNQDFRNTLPTLAEIETEIEIEIDGNNNNYKYENESWELQVSKNSFLFFDADFTHANVHTHGSRENDMGKGGHTQKAGKLIISLDEGANNRKEEVNKCKDEIAEFKKESKGLLGQDFTEYEGLFNDHKDDNDKTKKEKLSKAQEELKKLEEDLATLEKNKNQKAEIDKLSEVEQIDFPMSLPPKNIFTELFNHSIKEKAQDEANEKIKAHFAKHRQFIETAREQIPENYEDQDCPLCMQPLANAAEVIDYYRAVFDQDYEKAKQQFLSDIKAAKDGLEVMKSNLSSLLEKVGVVFNTLEKIEDDFGIQDIYKREEKTEQTGKFGATTVKEIADLIVALESLEMIEREQMDVTKLYDAVDEKIQEANNLIESVNNLVNEKNKLITNFKSKYSDPSTIINRIDKKTQEQKELKDRIDFLESEKIKHMKDGKEALREKKRLSKELKNKEEDLEAYLAETIPESVISQMNTIIGKFGLGLTLKHSKFSPKTKDYPFEFEIKDQKSHKREMKDGLSEGELQIISLAFFFAIKEKLKNKGKTVLIFDDPITSLDSPNLKTLSELIHQQTKEFSQVLVFTHHPLFFKYLTKCTDPKPSRFSIYKNKDEFGGSFIFSDPGFDLFTEVKQCSEEINQNAQNGNLKLEEITLKYGHLLRLAVEKFIKNDLLMWDKEGDFNGIVKDLKDRQYKMVNLSDDVFDTIAKIHQYCNYSNFLHIDKEMPSSLSELMDHINKFVEILTKTKPKNSSV